MPQFNLPILPTDDENSELPLPLIVAQNWDFPLAHTETSDGAFYAIQDWIRGLTSTEDVRQIWVDFQHKNNLSELSFPKLQLPYVATNGKTYQMDFTNDKGLYLIAQHLRATKARPALSAIKRFLAEAGVFVDQVRRDPHTVFTSGAVDPEKVFDAVIDMYHAQGKDDRWIAARLESKIKRNQFTSALQAAVSEMLKRQHYAMATNQIYVGLWKRTAANLKKELNLPKSANLRDHQPRLALHYQGIAEEVCANKLGDRAELSWYEALDIIKMVAGFVGAQAQATSQLLNMDIATGKPLLPAPLNATG